MSGYFFFSIHFLLPLARTVYIFISVRRSSVRLPSSLPNYLVYWVDVQQVDNDNDYVNDNYDEESRCFVSTTRIAFDGEKLFQLFPLQTKKFLQFISFSMCGNVHSSVQLSTRLSIRYANALLPTAVSFLADFFSFCLSQHIFNFQITIVLLSFRKVRKWKTFRWFSRKSTTDGAGESVNVHVYFSARLYHFNPLLFALYA